MAQKVSKSWKDLIRAEVIDIGALDYIDADGDLVQKAPLKAVMVRTVADLGDLADLYEPGTFAFTAGFTAIWQLDTAGTWQEV